MLVKLILIGSLLNPGGYYQPTDIPTLPPAASPTPTPEGTWLHVYIPSPTYIPSYTPLPTLDAPVDESDAYGFLATAAANLNTLPDDPGAPSGMSFSNTAASSGEIFSYGKWLFSSTSAMELLGPQLGPLGIKVATALGIVILFATIDLILRFVVVLVKGIVWLVQQIIKFIPFIG
jgi:hypothetical protein